MKRFSLILGIILSSSILGFADPLPEHPPTITPLTSTSFNLDWDGTLGNTYFVQYSADLISWDYMPVIKNGVGGPLGYGFDAPGDKLFLRLHYTDVATSNALTDDFDNDGISNWDEVRHGGTGTSPFLYQDLNGNGIADDWELFWDDQFSAFPKTVKAELTHRESITKNIYLSNPVSPDADFTVAVQNNIAPNQVGYSSTDSVTGTAVYAWNDISTTGTLLSTISDADDTLEEITLNQITVPFYGTAYNNVFVSSNGLITFSSGSSARSNQSIPSTSTPNLFIAPFWDDLDTRDNGDVYYKEESDKLIIQYENVAPYYGTGTYTFQAVIHTNGGIEFFYKSMAGDLDSATVGVENIDGSDGLEISHNSATYIQNLMAVKLSYGPLKFVEVAPLSGTTTIGNISSLDVNFHAWNLPPGTYTADIQVAHTGTGISPWNIPAILDVTNPPTNIAITSPSNGETFLSSQNIYFRVTATDDDFGIERVEFYDGTTKLSEDTTSSYYHYWNNLTAGTHELTAKAIDQFGTETTSSKVTVTVLADSDNDSMADDWEMLHFGDLDETAYTDFDNDGYTNLEEYEGGHNPKVVEDTDSDGMPDGWEEDNYFDLEVNDAGDDEDNDGLSNFEEWENETNPRDPDSDNDKLPDGWEVQYGLDPNTNDSALDADNDNVSNLLEYALGFNPSDNDSDNDSILDASEDRDGDGMPDAWEAETGKWVYDYNSQTGQYEYTLVKALDWEVADATVDFDTDGLNNLQEYQAGTKPNNFDTDGDFLPDGWEVQYGLNPLGGVGADGADGDIETDVAGVTGDGVKNYDEYSNNSDPTKSDTDGDGVGDLQEINQGSNPNNSNDNGQAPPPEEIKEVPFHIYGDYASWEMIVEGLGPDDTRVQKLHTDNPGENETKTLKLRTGNKYEVTMKWLRTIEGQDLEWYCWEAQIDSKPTVATFNDYDSQRKPDVAKAFDVAHCWIVDNSEGLLTSHVHSKDGGGGNIAGSLKATLYPVEILPDYDHDGMIDDDGDSGKATEETPFVFWINDDDDGNIEPEIADIPESNIDNADDVVNGQRDLVDFFPIQLRLKKMLELLPSATHNYKISHPTGALHFIEMPNIQPESQRESTGAGSYLANETMAQYAMSQPMNSTAGEGTALTDEYLEAVTNGMGALLFESTEETNQSFELIVTKKQGGDVKAHIKDVLKMKTKQVEKLYWRANIRPAVYGNPVPNVVEAAEQQHVLKDRWFVFCHGYNVSESRARGWNAEMFKRLTQMGFQSKFLAVSWEGNQGQISGLIPLLGNLTPDYWHNIYNAFRSSSHLADLVNALSGGDVVIAGHSMGNMLVSSSICNQNLNAEQYFMINAAVARGAYAESHVTTDRGFLRHPNWANHPTRLWSTDYWSLFPSSDGRHKLKWKGIFSNLASETSPHNFYSTGEEVLKNSNGTSPSLIGVSIRGELSWVKQEMGKGEFTKKLVTGAHTANAGWAFNSFWNGTPPATNTPLIANPFFKPFTIFHDANGQNPQSIHGANGSDIAELYLNRSFLLGHDIPALTHAAGSNHIEGYPGTNMHTACRTGTWGDWKHSDLKNRPMHNVWKVHAEMVSKGKLNKTVTPPPTN